MTKIAIETRELRRTFRMGATEVVAVGGVSLTIKEGAFVALMGPSGSGKSTLLHLLGLLDEPTSGDILIHGKNVSKLSPMQKTNYRLTKLGYVFQEYNLLPELTALENVALPLMEQGVSKQEYTKRAKIMLEKVDMGDRAQHMPSELSGGQMQRVSIARALISNPAIIFADEPTANLDTIAGKRILNLFSTLNKKYGQTILMVSHEPEHKHIVDYVIRLRDGLVLGAKRPKMNLIKCTACDCRMFRSAAVKKMVKGKEMLFCSEKCAKKH